MVLERDPLRGRAAGVVKERLKASLGIEASEDEPASSLLSRVWAEPSMDVHGVAGWRFRSPKRLGPASDRFSPRWNGGTGDPHYLGQREFMSEPSLKLVDFGAPGRGNRLRILCLGRDAGPELLSAEALPFPPQR